MTTDTDTSDTEILGAIFVDMPNVSYKQATMQKISWRTLLRHVRTREFGETPVIHGGLYAIKGREAEAGSERRHLDAQFERDQYELHVRIAKDIDSWIVNDIWMSVAKAQERVIEKNQALVYPLRMRHVLVSGDVGYLRAYRSLLDVYGPNLEIELTVYTWESNMSNELARFANRVRFLDNIPGLIIP